MNRQSKPQSVNELFGIYIALRDDLYRFILSKVKSRDDAEDIVQHLYVQLSQMSEDRVINIVDSRIYIFGMANILALSHLRKLSRTGEFVTSTDIELDKNDDVDDPGRILATRQTMDVLKQTLNKMPAKRRQVFMYYRFRNMSVKEIAHDLDLTTHAVEKHIVRALLLCRESLQEAGL